MYDFSVDYGSIDVDDIPDNHKYLLNKNKITCGLMKKADVELLGFGESLVSMVINSIHAKCLSLNNQPCMTRPTLINLNSDQYN